MRWILVGHRGTGKTTLLRRLARYLPDHDCVDLDSEIELQEGQSISRIFYERGEEEFRRVERQTFRKVLERFENFPNAVIALGAGFEFTLPEDFQVLYVRRDSDLAPRVFMDRPALDANLSPRASYLSRLEGRSQKYIKAADRIWTMAEGSFFPSEKEKSLLLETATNLGGFLTLLPTHFQLKDPGKLFASYLKQGIEGFEFRDDLLNQSQLELALSEIPAAKRLLSFRSASKISLEGLSAHLKDWDVDLGPCRSFDPDILSWHGQEASWEKSFVRVEQMLKSGKRIKWSPELESLQDLKTIHEWKKTVGPDLLFFPRTPSSSTQRMDWSWYRLLHKTQALQFWRDAEGSSADQPILERWHLCPEHVSAFAAILGSPVRQSFSPGWHAPFFSKRGLPFFYIDFGSNEDPQSALEFLSTLGLRFAAVTSPLKERLFALPGIEHDVRAQKYHALNTLVWDSGMRRWRSTNTDFQGFQPLVEDLPRDRVAIWGGGGTANIIKDVYPRAAHYSARTGELKSGVSVDPEVLIWAAGPSAGEPQNLWHPKYVVDLSYTQDSCARDYALKIKARYRSGQKMFARQAMKQQAFWSRYGE